MYEIQCPSCFEWFSISLAEDEAGDEAGESYEVDYDCEICCRPMLVVLNKQGAFARSLDDL